MRTSPDVEADPLLPRVCAAGLSMRRLEPTQPYPAPLGPSAQHSGDRVRMRTWEDAKENVVRQELVFLGMAVEFQRGLGIRTGTADESTSRHSVKPGSFAFHASPSLRTLELGARLLRETGRDYFTQHLLQQINEALTLHFKRPQTEVFGLLRWRRRLGDVSGGLFVPQAGRLPIIVYVAIGAAIGAISALMLLKVV